MRVTKHEHLYQLTFLPRFFPVNCYLVEEDDGMTLIDAGLPYSWKGIVRVCESLGKPMKRIVLTHAHDDHVGSLDVIKNRFPEVPIYISKRDARLLEGDRSLDEHERQVPIKGGVPKNVQSRADLFLNDGDRIGSLEVISTPGHTPGSMSFLDVRNNSMIAGDAFQTRGGVAVSGDLLLSFPFPAWATWNKGMALESAEKIWKQKPSMLAVGHGEMIQNPQDEMQVAISRAYKRGGK